jgi:hypothetical protein
MVTNDDPHKITRKTKNSLTVRGGGGMYYFATIITTNLQSTVNEEENYEQEDDRIGILPCGFRYERGRADDTSDKQQ